MLIAFHKPYGVLSQFTSDVSKHRTLADFGFPKHAYPVGRLDKDSEGLLLLSDEGKLIHELLDPRHNHPRTYWVQVEGLPDTHVLEALRNGVTILGKKTRPCSARFFDPAPDLPPRDPPIRFRKAIPTSWLEMTLSEGRNRQVRRMTAAVGYPTLRLIRMKIGGFRLEIPVGTWKELTSQERRAILSISTIP